MNSVFLHENPNVEIHLIADPTARKGDYIEADVRFNPDETSTLTIRTKDGEYPDKRMLIERIRSLAALARHKFLGRVLSGYEILPGRTKREKLAFIEEHMGGGKNIYPDLTDPKERAKRLYYSFWEPNNATSNSGNHYGYIRDDPISIILRREKILPEMGIFWE